MVKYKIQKKLFYTLLVAALHLTTTVYLYIIHVTLYEFHDRVAVGGAYVLFNNYEWHQSDIAWQLIVVKIHLEEQASVLTWKDLQDRVQRKKLGYAT
jgi:hypothetical protein